MKANELMIGDWVRKLERGGHSIPVKIIAIYEYNADYETRDGNVGCMSIHGYEPIPLTAEILKKNGFRIYGDNAKYEEESDYNGKATVLYVQYHRHGNLHIWREYEFSRDGEQHVIDWYDPKLEFHTLYVHELQHALRLCGIEKEIDL